MNSLNIALDVLRLIKDVTKIRYVDDFVVEVEVSKTKTFYIHHLLNNKLESVLCISDYNGKLLTKQIGYIQVIDFFLQ